MPNSDTTDGFEEWISGYKWGFVCGVIAVLICVVIVAGVANA